MHLDPRRTTPAALSYLFRVLRCCRPGRPRDRVPSASRCGRRSLMACSCIIQELCRRRLVGHETACCYHAGAGVASGAFVSRWDAVVSLALAPPRWRCCCCGVAEDFMICKWDQIGLGRLFFLDEVTLRNRLGLWAILDIVNARQEVGLSASEISLKYSQCLLGNYSMPCTPLKMILNITDRDLSNIWFFFFFSFFALCIILFAVVFDANWVIWFIIKWLASLYPRIFT